MNEHRFILDEVLDGYEAERRAWFDNISSDQFAVRYFSEIWEDCDTETRNDLNVRYAEYVGDGDGGAISVYYDSESDAYFAQVNMDVVRR